MHDSSACIVRDGELLFAVAEERISRVKHDARFPVHAIEACLGFANVRAEQVDEVCFGWQTAGPVFRHDLKMYGTGQWPATYLNVLNSSRHFLSMWHQESGARVFERTFGTSKPRMRFVEHHLAHAISAYGYSGFDDAAIVIMDGRMAPGRPRRSGVGKTDGSSTCRQFHFQIRSAGFTARLLNISGLYRTAMNGK